MENKPKMKVKTILVSQPKPEKKSPYFGICERYKVKMDFIPFVHVEGVSARDIRNQRVDFSKYSAIIFTSKNVVDYFFDAAKKMRYEPTDDIKYFCQSGAISNYLQKYITYRKRRIYKGQKTLQQLKPLLKKYETEKFLLPCSNKLSPFTVKYLNELNVNWTKVELCKTVKSNLSHLENVFYDILVFFSPSGIESLYHNFPNFKQNNTRIAVFGISTIKFAKKAGLKIDIQAPTEAFPSMAMALEDYIREANKGK